MQIKKALLSITIMLCASNLLAQSLPNFEAYANKYPSHAFVRINDASIVNITLNKNNVPVIEVNETYQLLVLKDNVRELSSWKSFFNGKDEILKTEVYSLVNNKGKARRLNASGFTKLSEVDPVSYFDDNYSLTAIFPSTSKSDLLCSNTHYRSHDAAFGYKHYFGSNGPVEKSSLQITVPSHMQLTARLAGNHTDKIKYSTIVKGKTTTHTWEFSDISAYKNEPYSPSFRYYVPHIVVNIAGFEIDGKYNAYMGDANDFHRWFYSKIKNTNTQKNDAIVALSDSITKPYNTRIEKVAAIYAWVQNNIKYIAIVDGDNGFVPQNAANVIACRYGDCKAKSSVITAMLHAIGEKASLACIGTRHLPYSFDNFPNIGTANHMIAIWWKTPEQPVPLDGTTRFLSIDEPPAFIQGKQCFIAIDEQNFVIHNIPIMQASNNKTTETLHLKIADNKLIGNGISTMRGETASTFLQMWEGKDEKTQKDIVVSFLDLVGNKFEINNIAFEKLAQTINHLQLSYNIALPDYCVNAGNRLYVNANIHQPMSDIDLKADRERAVEIEQTIEQNITTNIEIPIGYKLISMPENQSYEHEKFGFEIKYIHNNNLIVCNTKLRADFLLLEGEALQQFRQMLHKLQTAYRKSLVFEKI